MNIVKARKLMADKFLFDLSLKTSFEDLIQMVQTPYLSDLVRTYIDRDTVFSVPIRSSHETNYNFRNVFGSNYSKKCQRAFLDKLILLTRGDKNVLLAFVSLRGWWRIRDRGRWLLEGSLGSMRNKSDSTEKFVDKVNYLGVNAIRFLTPKYFQLPNHAPEKCDTGGALSMGYVTYLNNLRSQYEFAVTFDFEIQAKAINKLISGLETFGAFRQLYGSGQHGGTIGVTLLTLGCKLAKTKEDLILVTRWLFNAKRSEAEHLTKHLKPLLKKLIATL